MTTPQSIPYERIETVFLDVGNTLVSMDYEWIREELEAEGVTATLDAILRAEAAARPVISAAIANEASTEGLTVFELYLRTLIERLESPGGRDPHALAARLAPVLRDAGRRRLWTRVLPGVPEALAILRGSGRKLAVVSNSDGTVEQVLKDQGLRDDLAAVFDSAVVGYEKPDPELFHHALRETGSTASTTLHIGDLYAADVVGGRAAGLHTALLDPFGDWSSVDCVRFRDLREAAEAFRATLN